MSAAAFFLTAVIFVSVCLGLAATGNDPDPVTLGIVSFLSACAGCLLA